VRRKRLGPPDDTCPHFDWTVVGRIRAITRLYWFLKHSECRADLVLGYRPLRRASYKNQ